MEHILLPSRPRLPRLDFPLLCQPAYHPRRWDYFPQEHGFQVIGEISGDFQVTKIVDGQPRDISEDDTAVAAFFQQWLWFGVLLEMLETVDAADFVRTRSDGTRWLCTVELQQSTQKWVASVSDQHWVSDPDALQEWSSRRWQMIRRTRTIVMRYLETYECSADDQIAMTILAIALLGEHLHLALSQIFNKVTTGLQAWDVIPPFNWRESDADCAMVVVQKLSTGGWCPHTLAGMGINVTKIEALWFYANLEAPKAALPHDACTSEQCVHLQIDEKTYRTKHTTDDCQCDLVGPDPVALARVVLDGKLPLTRVVFDKVGQIEKIDVEPRESDTTFVAISHVWADGHGNPTGNLLPTCFLRELQVQVDDVAGMNSVLFWMDTLAIPREPRSVRKIALKKLRDPYEYAAHVLVLDAYLQSQQSQNCSAIELFALVNVSSWSQRLWTFQEGQLAKDIRIQFADGTIDMSDGAAAKEALRSKVISEATKDIIAFHTSTRATREFWNIDHQGSSTINSLREGVRLRSTSVATDEALCLGSIAGLDMGKLLDQSDVERMDTFWRMFPQIPASLALSKASRKSESKGLRWAPASLMGDIEVNDWDGPTDMQGEFAEVTSEGLLCQLSALKFPSVTPMMLEKSLQALFDLAGDEDHEIHAVCHGITLRTHDGQWLACNFEEAWHQTPHNILQGQIPAVLIEHPTYLFPGSQPSESSAGENIAALFVALDAPLYGPSGGIRAHGIRHCSLYLLSHKYSAFLEELDTISHQLMSTHSDAIIAKAGDWDATFDLVKLSLPVYVLDNDVCLQLGRAAVAALRGTDDFDDQVIVDNAIAIVASFLYIGLNRYVENGGVRESWIIS